MSGAPNIGDLENATGLGVRVAIVDSGIRASDPRLVQDDLVPLTSGWSIQMEAAGHAQIAGDFDDTTGHGTMVAAAVRAVAPQVELIAVRIYDRASKPTADVIAAGIETAARGGARIINVSLGSGTATKASVIRHACLVAEEVGAVVVSAAHPAGGRAYPADLPEAVGVAAKSDLSSDELLFLPGDRYPRSRYGNQSDKFLARGDAIARDGRRAPRGSGFAAAFVSGRLARLAQCMPEAGSAELREALMASASLELDHR